MDSLNDSDNSSTSSDSEEEEMDVEEEEDANDIGVQDPYEGGHGNSGSSGSNMGNNYTMLLCFNQQVQPKACQGTKYPID